MEFQQHRRSLRRSSSRSPSLTRRSSFKDKATSSGISKSKKKSGSKKERWLLTRKTWRYMSDAVGALLPEHKEKTRSNSPTGPSTSRRPSSSLSSPHTPTTPGPTTASYSCGIVPAGHSYTTTVASVPASHGYGTSGTTVTHVHAWPAYTPTSYHEPVQPPSQDKRYSAAIRSSICSGIAPLSEPEPDIPATEEGFEQMCQKEKKFLLWTRTRPKGLSGPALKEFKDKRAERRRTSSSSSILGRPETPETPHTATDQSLRSKRCEELLEYYSPEDEDLMDDYDDYDLDEEQMTVREFPPRKSSSGASSVVSILSAGQSFWRPPGSSGHGHTTWTSSPSSDSYTVVTVGPGIQKYYRTTGIQTEPFPEEILIRLRLQSVREEQLQREEAEALRLREVKGQEAIGVETSPTECLESKVSLESPCGHAEDKKSEESGYSSSISDTVMRYLRMVRKNSKPDTKEAIDKFKTVNYDRSLRYIKSKNVTVEEALEHEKNKALALQQKGQESAVAGGGTTSDSKAQSEQPRKGSQAVPPKTKKQSSGSDGKKKKSGSLTPGSADQKADEVPSPPSLHSEISSPELCPSPPLSPPPPPEVIPPPSIGIQAGESLVRFLRNLNPMRKGSFMSSYYGSSESPGDVMSPRYSIATGSDASEFFCQSACDDASSSGPPSFQCQYNPPEMGPDRHRLSSDFSDLGMTFQSKKQSSYLSSGSSGYMTETLKKSSSAVQMRSKGSASPSPFIYPKDYVGPKTALSSSTPTTPTISPKPGHSDSSGKMSRHIPTYSSGPVQFFSGLRRKGSAGREKADPSSSAPTVYSPSPTSSGGIAESISSFLSKRSSSYGKPSGTSGGTKVSESSSGGSGNSGLSFSLRRAGSGKRGGGSEVRSAESSSTTLTNDPPSTVMQKSKSSSSVFHGEKRGSTSSATGLTTVGPSPAASSSGSRLMSKTRIFKSRSKSTGRSTPVCAWTPQGNGKWVGQGGQTVNLTDTNILNLNATETEALQKIIHAKVKSLNPGLDFKIPKESKPVAAVKPKRRPYVLKKKALSTGFFESSASKEEPPVRIAIGNVFGISLAEAIRNDKKRAEAESTSVITKLGHSTFFTDSDGSQKRSSKQCENGGRNSLSQETSLSKKKEKLLGSTESLAHQKRGSTGGSDPLATVAISSLGDAETSITRKANEGAVPQFVLKCIQYLEQHALHTVGVFRVSSNRMRVRQLREDVESGKESVFGEECNVHDVAALLKEFLRDLPEALLCNDLYHAFLNTNMYRSNRKLQLEATQHIIQLLPVHNRDTLAVLLKFLANMARYAEDHTCPTTGVVIPGNKMDSCNLATVIAPNLIPFLPPNAQLLDPIAAMQSRERRDSIDVVDFMITNYKELFNVKADVLDEVYHSLLESAPDVLETILKEKAADDVGLDDLDNSSVFGGSELGEPSDLDEAAAPRRVQKREEIVHKEGGKGGQPDKGSGQTKPEKARSKRDQSKDRGGSGDTEKQSGGESDSSTKSTSRWFRRSRQDPKARTSSDSGGEKAKAKRCDSGTWEPKRASSLDSVTLQDSRGATIVLVTEKVEPKRSTSHQNLQVPEASGRRQSSPVLEHGVITASLKIPVPLNLDEAEIPFIEEEHLDGRLILSPDESSARSGKIRAQIASGSEPGRSGTPSSASHATTPPSSPGRLSSTSMTFSPPMSPEEDTFQFETMTARFLINPSPLFTTTPNTSTVVTQTKLEQLQNKSTLKVLPLDSTSSVPTSPPVEPKPSTSNAATEPLLFASHPKNLDSLPIDPKVVGKETKGANIAGLIKSKTADFEKIAKQSQQTPLPCSTISQNLRLRNQGNIHLKQEFLLRQQRSTSPTRRAAGPSRSGSSGGIVVTASSTGERHRAVTRKKDPVSPTTPNPKVDEPSTATGSAQQTPGTSRWKRSELISSNPTGEGSSTGRTNQR